MPMMSAGTDSTATPWQRGGLHGGYPTLSLTPLHRANRLPWDPDPALGTPRGHRDSPSAPMCTSMHQYTPAFPAMTKAMTPPKAANPMGTPGKAPSLHSPIKFLCKKQAAPAAGTIPGGTQYHRIRAQVQSPPCCWQRGDTRRCPRGGPHPGKCWRCTRKLGSQSGWSPRGVSAPGSASF